MDATNAADTNAEQVGKRIVLAPSFVNSPRYRHKLYQNAMAIAREYGKPDIFLTFTCNPKWPEIDNELRRDANGEKLEEAIDRPGVLLLLKSKHKVAYCRPQCSRLSGEVKKIYRLHHEANRRSSIRQGVLRQGCCKGARD